MSYQLLELIAISGEFPVNAASKINCSKDYLTKVIKQLKSDELLLSYYRNKVRGYRLTKKAKDQLLHDNANRYSFYLTGNAETNQVKSELVRRLRLHRLAETYLIMLQTGISVFRDLKPDLLTSDGWTDFSTSSGIFYTSREIKQIGMDAIKISGSRMTGTLLTEDTVFITYNGGNGLPKIDYRAEQRTKAMVTGLICHEKLPDRYHPDQVYGLMLGEGMTVFAQILSSADSKTRCFFLLDCGYKHFYYLTNDRKGQVILKLLCDIPKRNALEQILMDGLYPPENDTSVDADAVDPSGKPVLFAYFLDIPRINRFCNGLRLHQKQGILICFDFQADTLNAMCGNRVLVQSIRFEKFEGSFFETH